MDRSCLHSFQVFWLPHLCLRQRGLTWCIWCLLSPSTCYLWQYSTCPYNATLLWLDSDIQKCPRFRSLRPPSFNARPRKHNNDNAQQNKRWLAWQVPHVRFHTSLHNDRIQTSRLHRLSDRNYQVLGRPAQEQKRIKSKKIPLPSNCYRFHLHDICTYRLHCYSVCQQSL